MFMGCCILACLGLQKYDRNGVRNWQCKGLKRNSISELGVLVIFLQTYQSREDPHFGIPRRKQAQLWQKKTWKFWITHNNTIWINHDKSGMFREFLPLDPIAKSRRWSPWASARRWAAPPQRLAMWMRSGELSDMVALGHFGIHKKAVVLQIICLGNMLVSCMASVVRDSTWFLCQTTPWVSMRCKSFQVHETLDLLSTWMMGKRVTIIFKIS